jgi:chromosome segregation ATPase
MSTEIEYNLAINKLKQQKMVVEKEVDTLIYERDKVRAEIADQRNATSVVYHEQRSLETIRHFLQEQTKLLSEIRSKNYQNFSADYDKHKTILKEIEESIERSQKLMDDFNVSKDQIKALELRKENLSNEIVAKTNELTALSDSIRVKSGELDRKIAENKAQLAKIEQEKKEQWEQLEAMRKFEKDLQLMEKRLNAYKEQLHSLKTNPK